MKTVISCPLFVALASVATAYEVTDWNRIMLDALHVPPAVAVASRAAACRDPPGRDGSTASIDAIPHSTSNRPHLQGHRSGLLHVSGLCKSGSAVSKPGATT